MFFGTPLGPDKKHCREISRRKSEESRIEKKEKRVENFRNIVQVLPDSIDNDDYNDDPDVDVHDKTVKHNRAELA